MNYRHAFHAGNFADVVKHAVLALLIERLQAKDTAFRVIDTHAGIGLYDLAGDEAARTGEWQSGIARLWGAKRPPTLDALVKPYLAAVAAANGAPEPAPLVRYPGSPWIVRQGNAAPSSPSCRARSCACSIVECRQRSASRAASGFV